MNSEGLLLSNYQAQLTDIDTAERTLKCYIVSPKVNRYFRKIELTGMLYENYLRSPVVLFNHDDSRPIGRCMWLKIEKEGILAKVQFNSTALAQEIFQLYKEGYLTSWSIGFLPHSYEWIKEEKQEILHITRWELFEFSAVPIPADPNAITVAIEQGLVKHELLLQHFSAAADKNTGNINENQCPGKDNADETENQKQESDQQESDRLQSDQLQSDQRESDRQGNGRPRLPHLPQLEGTGISCEDIVQRMGDLDTRIAAFSEVVHNLSEMVASIGEMLKQDLNAAESITVRAADLNKLQEEIVSSISSVLAGKAVKGK